MVFHFMVHYPTRDVQRRLGLLKQEVTIFTITLNDLKKILTITLNDLNTEKKSQSSGDLNPRLHAVQACTMGATHQPGNNGCLQTISIQTAIRQVGVGIDGRPSRHRGLVVTKQACTDPADSQIDLASQLRIPMQLYDYSIVIANQTW